jgi:hypothetical protein
VHSTVPTIHKEEAIYADIRTKWHWLALQDVTGLLAGLTSTIGGHVQLRVKQQDAVLKII